MSSSKLEQEVFGALILLIEDNSADQRLFSEAIRTLRFHAELEVLPNGAVALQYLFRRGNYTSARLPDLIVMDLNIPRMDGLTLLTAIKNDPGLSAIPLIVLTSSQASSDREAALAAEAYVVKPVDLDDYFDAVLASCGRWLVRLPE